MKKIVIAGAGGAPSEGVINSLLKNKKSEIIIGIGSEPTDLVLSNASKKYLVPYADSPDYFSVLTKILKIEKPNLIHFQNDLEIFYASKYRHIIHSTGTKTFMPDHDVIDTCVHKYKSYLKIKDAGIKVPENIFINNEFDLKEAFRRLGDSDGKIWLRSSTIGGGGKGALPTNNFSFAKIKPVYASTALYKISCSFFKSFALARSIPILFFARSAPLPKSIKVCVIETDLFSGSTSLIDAFPPL